MYLNSRWNPCISLDRTPPNAVLQNTVHTNISTSAVLHAYTDREAHLLYTASTLMRSPGDAVPHMPICKHNTQCGGKQLCIHATYIHIKHT